MLHQQHFLDLGQDSGDWDDPKSWLSEDGHHHHSSYPASANASATASNGNVDRVLFKNLVEMVPLVESLMDRRVNTSFTRRASLIYTRTPARESPHKKVTDGKGRKTARKRVGDNEQTHNNSRENLPEDLSTVSSKAVAAQKERDDLTMLQEQVEDLQKKLLEKDELLKSAESSISQLKLVNGKLDDLKRQLVEKDLLIKSSSLQLSDAKIKLADKQAAVEKLQWEVTNANSKAEKLEKDLESVDCEAATIMEAIEALAGADRAENDEKKQKSLDYFDQLPFMGQVEDVDEIELQHMEEARQEYLAAVAHAKESPSEESLAMAAKARIRLQSFVLGAYSIETGHLFHRKRINGSDDGQRPNVFPREMLVQ